MTRKILKISLLIVLAILISVKLCRAEIYPLDGFVYVKDSIPSVQEEIRYASDYNFIGRPVDGYLAPRAILTYEAVTALKKAAEHFSAKGLYFRIYDAYRPEKAVQDFFAWKDNDNIKMKSIFYPDLEKSELFPQYIAVRSGHSRGSTVDLTLEDKDGKILDMGSDFDVFSPISGTFYPNITDEQKTNRLLLREGMIAAGFLPYDDEWWHFTLNNEPYPNKYFNFDVK